jgi:hypothetical protein
MSNAKEERERWVGDHFIAWYNQRCSTDYRYDRRGGEAPDLVYRDGATSLNIEVTEAYYDSADAVFKTKTLRGRPDAPRAWAAVEPDGALIINVGARLDDKALKSYGRNCILVVNVDATVTSAAQLERLLAEVSFPTKHSFRGIYVGGFFGWSSDGDPGYRCWPLFEA